MQPAEFAQYKVGHLVRTLGALDQLNQSKQTTKDTDFGSFIQRQTYDAQGRPIGAPERLTKTPTISEQTGRGNLALAQSQEDWKRKNPGYDIKETETGLVGVNKNNPRDVVPITVDGKAVGAKAPPAKLVEIDTQLSSLAGSLKAFKNEVAKNKLTGARGLFTGEDTANMTSKYTSLLMGVKDLYTLGALTGPDMSIIENQLQNPASWAGSMTSKAAFNAQIKTIEDMLRRNHINTETAFGRPLKATTAALKSFGDTAAGNVDNDPLGLRKPK
jgi:YD repeat-containing protein